MGDTKTIASFFSGYGGLEMGIRSALGGECRTIVFVEREAYAVANLVAKIEAGLLDAAPIHTDVTTFPYRKFRGLVDIACGGVPCQPHSVAGKRKGGGDERFLFDAFFDGLEEMQPRQIFIENVEGLLTSKMPDGSLCFRYIIERLEKMDYSVKAGLFTAAEVGAPHRRKRVFILAHARCVGQKIGQVPSAGAIEPSEVLDNSTGRRYWIKDKEIFSGWNSTIDAGSGVENSECIGRGRRSESGCEVRGCGVSEDKTTGSGASSEVLGNAPSQGFPWNRASEQLDNIQNAQRGSGERGNSDCREHEEVLGNAEHNGLHGAEVAGSITEAVPDNTKRTDTTCEPTGTDTPRELADTNEQRPQGRNSTELPERSVKWPARPGQPQYDWEEPRVVERKLGGAASRSKCWVDAVANRVDRLRLCGNGVVPQQAARAWQVLNSFK